MVVSEPFELVRHPSAGCWPTSVSEVHLGHLLHMGLEAHVSVLYPVGHVSAVRGASRMLAVFVASPVLAF